MTIQSFKNGYLTASGYTDAVGSGIASLPDQDSILGTVDFDPTGNVGFDTFVQFQMDLGASMTTASTGTPYVGISCYPINDDASTYGDTRFVSAAAGQPPSQYQVAQIPMLVGTSVAQRGTSQVYPLPFIGVKHRWVVTNWSLGGATFPDSTHGPSGGPPLVRVRYFNPQDI